jgi:dihydrodipicolinate synthase/N-acetylneuraminate lyase
MDPTMRLFAPVLILILFIGSTASFAQQSAQGGQGVVGGVGTPAGDTLASLCGLLSK